jgi:hypothetical protein
MPINHQLFLKEKNEKKYIDSGEPIEIQIKRHEEFMTIANKLLELSKKTKKHVHI